MRAITYDHYGPPTSVLRLAGDVDTPRAGAGDVLVRVMASSINRADFYSVVGRPRIARLAFGWPSPRHRVPGRDVAGIVETVGEGVTQLQPGDRVFGELEGGGYGEWAAAPADRLAVLPASIAFDDAATLPLAGCAALQALRAGDVRAGRRIVINGASGSVGTLAVAIAKALGAHVTAVCSARNLEQAKLLGADEVIDYAVTELPALPSPPAPFDVVVDLVGNHPPGALRRQLPPDGTLLCVGGQPGHLLRCALCTGQPAVRVVSASASTEDLLQLAAWVEGGEVRPAIEETIELDALPAALARHGEGRSRGKTVVRVGPEGG